MIFLDRSIPRSVATALKAVRADVVWLEDLFPHDTPDPEWLAKAGSEGWIVIVRDKHVNTRPGERQTIRDSGVGCFILNQGKSPTRWEYLQLLARTIDDMLRIDGETARPYIFTVSKDGVFRKVL